MKPKDTRGYLISQLHELEYRGELNSVVGAQLRFNIKQAYPDDLPHWSSFVLALKRAAKKI